MKVVLIPSCEWGSLWISFFFVHKNGVFSFQNDFVL